MVSANYAHEKSTWHDLGRNRGHMVENYVNPNWPLLFKILDPKCETKIQSSNAQKG